MRKSNDNEKSPIKKNTIRNNEILPNDIITKKEVAVFDFNAEIFF